MTKQEEITQGMEEIVSDMVYGAGAHYTSKEIVAKLQEYEDSEGVVIKVERELPTRFLYIGSSLQEVYGVAQEEMKEAGYVAVEPLI